MNLIFDFDGTICDSFDVAVKIVREDFPEYFTKEITPEIARKWGLKKLIEKTNFPKLKISKLMFKENKKIAKKIPQLKLFSYMKTVIQNLSKKHSLGIITSNSQENVEAFLKNNKINQYFDFIYSSTSLFGKDKSIKKTMESHKLKAGNTIYIGDQARDIEAGKKAGIKTIAVTWGYEAENVLKKVKPTYIVTKPKELLSLFN